MLSNWNLFDKFAHNLGQSARKLSRNGNGRIRVVVACIILVGMVIYPFTQM